MLPWLDERDKDRSSMIASSDSPRSREAKKGDVETKPDEAEWDTCDGCEDWMQSSSTS
jgi:hypothetical protein